MPPPARVRLLRLAASLLTALLMLCSPWAAAVEMHVFYGEGCPHCEEQYLFLDELQRSHPELQVRRYEVWREDTHHRLYREMSASHGVDAGSVPTVFLDSRVWVGSLALDRGRNRGRGGWAARRGWWRHTTYRKRRPEQCIR